MDKLIYINERGQSVQFSENSEYWVHIDRDCIGINDIENEIYINPLNGQNFNILTGHRTRGSNIEITGSLFAKDKNRRKYLIAKLNKTLFHKGSLYYYSGTEKRSIRVIAEQAPIYEMGDVIMGFNIVFTRIDNFWKSESDSTALFGAWEKHFMFPIVSSDTEKDIYFGEREQSLIVNVLNQGDIDAPIMVRMIASGAVKHPELYNVNTKEYMKVNVAMQFGDEILINTEPGNKSIILHRNGKQTNILSQLDLGSTWLKLASGDNLYRYNALMGLENLDISIRYSNLYLSAFGGV